MVPTFNDLCNSAYNGANPNAEMGDMYKKMR